MKCTEKEMKELIRSIEESKRTPIAVFICDSDNYTKAVGVTCRKCKKETFYIAPQDYIREMECGCPKCRNKINIRSINLNLN